MSFERAFREQIPIEGGYSDNPRDSGGQTMYGITEAVARRNGYRGAMRDMPLETARQMYKAQYWDLVRLDGVNALSAALAQELFDIAVNSGPSVAGRFLQRALNALNNKQQYYSDLVVDGIVGPATLAALRAYLDRRGTIGETVALRALNALQGARYISLAERREKDEEFVYGWILKRVVI